MLAGDYATVGGGSANSATGGDSTIGGGWHNTASSGFATVSGGYTNTVGAEAATIGGGGFNHADREHATIGGGEGNVASGDFAVVPGGKYAVASHYGEMAHASGSFSERGDAQASFYVLRNTTSDGTPAELYLDGDDDWLTIAGDRTLAFDILVAAASDGGLSAGYTIQGVIENVGGNTGFVGTPTVTELGEDHDWAVAVGADNISNGLVIWVTGEAATDIRWVATVRTAEVAW